MRRLTATLPLAIVLAACPAQARTNWAARIRLVGDHLLAQQTPHGAIPDTPGGGRANKDSTLCYALLALGHAYAVTQRPRFKRGMRDGIEWLAARMERREKGWTGSWRLAYAAKPPYVALPTPPGDGIADARGMSATSALFAYLLALYGELTDDDAFVQKYKPHVRAALDFVLQRNLGSNGLFYSSWHRRRADGPWTLYRMQYVADQADVYLGLRAGYHLHRSARYKNAAERLEREIPKLLYSRHAKAFGVALTPEGKLLPPDEGWLGYFVQGYLAWVFGINDETEHALRWLKDRQAPDGSFRRQKQQTPFALSAAVFCLATEPLADYRISRQRSMRWLRDAALSPQGGIRDFGHPKAPLYSNLAGWVVAAWADATPFPTAQPPQPGSPPWGWTYRWWRPRNRPTP